MHNSHDPGSFELIVGQLDKMNRQLDKQDAKLDKTLLQLQRNTSDIWWIKAVGSGIIAGVGAIVSYVFPSR